MAKITPQERVEYRLMDINGDLAYERKQLENSYHWMEEKLKALRTFIDTGEKDWGYSQLKDGQFSGQMAELATRLTKYEGLETELDLLKRIHGWMTPEGEEETK